MILNFFNVEKIVFENHSIKNLLTNHRDIFNKYAFFRAIGDLSKIKLLKIEFLSKIKEDDLSILKNYLKEDIHIEKLDNGIVKNVSCDLNNLNIEDFDYKDFCIYRNNKKIFMTFWR